MVKSKNLQLIFLGLVPIPRLNFRVIPSLDLISEGLLFLSPNLMFYELNISSKSSNLHQRSGCDPPAPALELLDEVDDQSSPVNPLED
jgi:hypothetical protein